MAWDQEVGGFVRGPEQPASSRAVTKTIARHRARIRRIVNKKHCPQVNADGRRLGKNLSALMCVYLRLSGYSLPHAPHEETDAPLPFPLALTNGTEYFFSIFSRNTGPEL